MTALCTGFCSTAAAHREWARGMGGGVDADLPMPPMARTLATMAIQIQQGSSGRVAVAHLATDPQFTADLEAIAQLDLGKPAGVVLDFTAVRHINSSNLSRLLRLRKRLIQADGKLVLCNLPAQVASVFQVTGLDRVFNFAADVEEALKLGQQ